MKKRTLSLLLALLLFCSCCVCLSSCKDKKTPIGLVVVYNGPDVTVTDKEFSAGEFLVLASYDDGTDEYVQDFEFEMIGLKQGYYVFTFTCRGYETEAYVRCHVPIYPSEKEG